MNLQRLTQELVDTKIYEAINSIDVDWDYPKVTILGTAGNSKDAGSGGLTDDSAQSEIIDPENQEPSDPGESGDSNDGQDQTGDSSGGGGESSSQKEVKVGSIIQDMESGEYGRVTSIDDDGSVEWDPVSKQELEDSGFFDAQRNTQAVRVKTSHLKGKGKNNEFIG
jgi:hypothetical protein